MRLFQGSGYKIFSKVKEKHTARIKRENLSISVRIISYNSPA
jgi:hypothetical protein